jgi:uncharacterized membrane protein
MGAAVMSWMLAIPMLGMATGLRSMTPMAVLCWFAYLGYLPVHETWAAWTAHLAAAVLFTVFALGELVADKLPRVPKRTSAGPLLVRISLGALAGAIAATAMHGPGLEGVLLGGLGALLGAFAGFMVRREVVAKLACADWPIALVEDLCTILAALFALHVITS